MAQSNDGTPDPALATTPATLVIELRQQLRAKLIFYMIQEAVAPEIRADAILTAFATTLAALQSQMPEKKSIVEFPETVDTEWLERYPHDSARLSNRNGFNTALDQTQAPLTALIQEMRHGD